MNEHELLIHEITIRPGRIDFLQFEDIKAQAGLLAEKIKSVEVGEENIKESKKLVAAVSKRVKELEDQRIVIKKAMLEPYTEFEAQVKEIVGIVKQAEEVVRLQVKQLEEHEREEKRKELEDIFSKRIIHYSFRDLFSFADFLKPKHLNKTTSIEAVEEEMVYFLERITADLKSIEILPNSHTILKHYLDTKDLAVALNQAHQERKREEAIQASKAIKQPTEEQIAYLVSVKVYSPKELKLLELLLTENDFEFITDKVVN